ncbi:hypothetical protein UCRPA7_2123 [Phaeoacremonium minimum UCRPA7]|uniref:Uncharacterized protein n=1 Tax=Phaeoacremonium minimum (strain UCR-PA7) TaxID=1286976 RepID=R8BSN1_PHAM7|nr:hypothetical protein UCRPA7_2123 [Phaeoacremonium minimum UCRPA7]EOO02372.1 hypothetical protein UCRPA7_2123 [Phaeoacremonium minimum UCRPA7]
MRNLAAPRNTKDSSSVGRMPVDKNNNNNHASSRQTPQMPTLAKGLAARAPLTPKVASRQTVTVATPLPRRAPRPESALSNGPTIATATTPNNNNSTSQRDDFATPVSTFLNSNVTPRSGSRQTRVDSANSTPTGTPNLSKSDSWDTRPGLGISGAGGDGDALRRPAVTFSPPPSDWRQEQQSSADSKFFYASDAKSSQQAALPKNPVAQTKTPTFFYANGENLPSNRAPPAPSVYTPTLGTPVPDAFASKFVYANGPPDLQPTIKASGPGSVASSGSRLSNGRLGPGTQSPASMMQRPASPVKMPSYPTTKSSTPSLVGGSRTAMSSAPQLAPANPALRRMSVETPSRVGGHSRAGSINTVEPLAGMRIPSNSSSDISSPSVLANPALTMASILQAAEDFAEHDDGSPDTLASPTKSTHGSDPLNELVANARRERKVQDLEITNASLEAINRTLERQLRKQTAELRRYRRLSRSGRLSLNSVGSVRSRIPSDSTIGEVPLVMDSLDLSDLSEEESEPEDDELDETDSEGSDSGSAQLSPNAVAARDARHRKRDEKRLQLDLSKHQELLIDSQKINQSLKRCLGLTEELIKDGKRALEYQVRVSEVEIGGRVLAPPDEDDGSSADSDAPFEDEASRTDDDDTQRIQLDEPSAGGNLAVWSKDPQDRDSGIELPRDGV